jgi:hypothetical protein
MRYWREQMSTSGKIVVGLVGVKIVMVTVTVLWWW